MQLPIEAHHPQVEAAVRLLNPGAHLLRCERGCVPLLEVLDTGRFDVAAAVRRPAWQQVGRACCVCMKAQLSRKGT